MTTKSATRYGTIEIRSYDGELDEIVATGCDFHLEQMDDGHWWIGIHKDGWEVHCNLSTKRGARIFGRAELADRPDRPGLEPQG